MENKIKLVIIGGGGHAKACFDVLSGMKEIELVGYTDKFASLIDSLIDLPYLGTDEVSKNLANQCYFLNAIGHLGDPSLRVQLTNYYKQIGANFLTCVAESAWVSNNAKLGEGSMVMHQAIISANTQIGDHCIINNKALIEHDCSLGNQVHVSTGALVNGGVKIGDNTFIGSGAIIRNGIEIGKNVVIGMGAVVTKSVPDGAKVKGNPARNY